MKKNKTLPKPPREIKVINVGGQKITPLSWILLVGIIIAGAVWLYRSSAPQKKNPATTTTEKKVEPLRHEESVKHEYNYIGILKGLGAVCLIFVGARYVLKYRKAKNNLLNSPVVQSPSIVLPGLLGMVGCYGFYQGRRSNVTAQQIERRLGKLERRRRRYKALGVTCLGAAVCIILFAGSKGKIRADISRLTAWFTRPRGNELGTPK